MAMYLTICGNVYKQRYDIDKSVWHVVAFSIANISNTCASWYLILVHVCHK